MSEIEEIQEEEGINDRSEAARQVIQRGINYSQGRSAGEQLGQQATAVASVGTVAAMLGAFLGQSWAVPLVIPFAMTVVVFALTWASIRTLEGRDVV